MGTPYTWLGPKPHRSHRSSNQTQPHLLFTWVSWAALHLLHSFLVPGQLLANTKIEQEANCTRILFHDPFQPSKQPSSLVQRPRTTIQPQPHHRRLVEGPHVKEDLDPVDNSTLHTETVLYIFIPTSFCQSSVDWKSC